MMAEYDLSKTIIPYLDYPLPFPLLALVFKNSLFPTNEVVGIVDGDIRFECLISDHPSPPALVTKCLTLLPCSNIYQLFLSGFEQLCSPHPIRMPQSNSSHNGNNGSSPPTLAPASGIPTNWPSYSQQQVFLPTQSHHQVRVKRESISCEKEDKSTVGTGAATLASTSTRTLASGDTPMPETSDFVKKLYR